MVIDQVASRNSSKGEVVVAGKKGKAVVELGSTPNKRKNYNHFHKDVGPSHFYKVILAPKLKCLPMPAEFTKHLTTAPKEFVLRTNIGCAWRVTIRTITDTFTIDKGPPPLTVAHKVRIGYLVAFKVVTPVTLKMVVFRDNNVEVVTKRKWHEGAFAMNL
ncbi:hypothetical protein VPH35_045475 [Triticum aestivum]